MRFLNKKYAMFLVSTFISVNAHSGIEKQYLTTDLQQYEKSGICENCNLANKDITGIPYSNLSGSNLVNSSFLFGNLECSNFSSANLTNAALVSKNLPNTLFNFANLTNTNFHLAELSNADFTHATINHTDFQGAILCGAKITQAQLQNAILSEDTLMPNCLYYKPPINQ